MANANDPNWLAYQRALGFETAETQRRTSVAIDEARRQRDFQLPIIGEQSVISERDISTARANAGMFDSSYTQQLLSERRREANQQTAGLELDTASTIAGLTSQASVDQARLQREAAERALQLGIVAK